MLPPKKWDFQYMLLMIYANGESDFLGCPTGDAPSHEFLGHTLPGARRIRPGFRENRSLQVQALARWSTGVS